MENLFEFSKHLEQPDENSEININREKAFSKLPDKVVEPVRNLNLTDRQLCKASCLFDAREAFGYIYPCYPNSKYPFTPLLPDINGNPFDENNDYTTKHFRCKKRTVWDLVKWLDFDPNINYAIFTGRYGHNDKVLTVLDFDQIDKFIEFFSSKQKDLKLPLSLSINTLRGKHAYLWTEKSLGSYSLKDDSGEIASLKSKFSQVVIGPGSLHESEKCYYTISNNESIAELSEDAGELLRSFFEYYGDKKSEVSDYFSDTSVNGSKGVTDNSKADSTANNVTSNTQVINSSCSTSKPWYLRDEQPDWEPKYSFDEVVKTQWREIANDDDMGKRVMKYLGNPVSKINSTFRCLLHPEENASCSIYRGDRTSEPIIGIKDHHERESSNYTLPEFYYGVVHDDPDPDLGSGELKIWFYRMLVESRVAEPPPEIEYPEPDSFKSSKQEYFYQHFIYLLRLNQYIDRNDHWKLVPFSVRFGKRWCKDIGSKGTFSDYLKELSPEYIKCYVETDGKRKLDWFGLGEKAGVNVRPGKRVIRDKKHKGGINPQYDEIFNPF